MENRNIIIILVAVIIVLAVVAGAMFLQSSNAKEPTKIKITSDKEQYENDGELSVKLTDLNKTPISKEIVNITITNKKGKVVFDNVVRTDKKGKAKIDLDLKKGKYKVNVTFEGNENYTGNSTTQKLTIKEEEKVTQTEESAVDSIEKYRTRPGTTLEVMPSGDVVEMSDNGAIIVSVNGDPNAYF